jgi:hypothetical protein
VRSIADELRERDREALAALTAAERVALALALGERDLQTCALARGIGAERARRVLRRNRCLGRRPSRCMDLINGEPA